MQVRNQTDEDVEYEVSDEPIEDPPPKRLHKVKVTLERQSGQSFEGFTTANVVHRAVLKKSGATVQVKGPVGLDVELSKLRPAGLAMQFLPPVSPR